MSENKLESYDYYKDLKIGDNIVLKEITGGINISGELRRIFFIKEKCYVVIYSFFHRKEIIYRYTRGKELLQLGKPKKKKKDLSPIIYQSLFEPEKPKNEKARSLFSKISIIFLLIIATFCLFPPIDFGFLFENESYYTFLNKNYTLNELFGTVNNRIHYRYDFDDNWMTPKSAWEIRYGDCEEFSSIVSAYLTTHKVTNYMMGLDVKNSNSGHAVVFVYKDNKYYIIDSTRALEKYGVKELKNARTLTEAVRVYTENTAEILKVPSYNGEQVVLDHVYQ